MATESRNVAATDESFKAFSSRNRELVLSFARKLDVHQSLTSCRAHVEKSYLGSEDKLLWIAVGLECSYPIITIYDYQQLLAAYWLSVAIEQSRGSSGQVGILFVCSDIAEVNRYNINYAFRDYYYRSGELGRVIADLVVDKDFGASRLDRHELYFTVEDLRIFEEAAGSPGRETYLDCVKRIKTATLQRLFPFNDDGFWARVAFIDFPLSAFRTWAAKPLGDIVASIHREEQADGSPGPLHAYRSAIGKSKRIKNVVRSDPFIAFCPSCGNSSLRIIESQYQRDVKLIKYHCIGHKRVLHRDYMNGSSDQICGCGSIYYLEAGKDNYYLDESGNSLGYPRFALASVVIDCAIWVMESTQVVNASFLRSLLSLQRTYRAGLLSEEPEPISKWTIYCCEAISCGIPADASIFAIGETGMKTIQRNLTLIQFGDDL